MKESERGIDPRESILSNPRNVISQKCRSMRNQTLCLVMDSPPYVPNTVIRRDLQTPTVTEEIRRYSSQYSARLSAHPTN
jgi:hypothetical protein